jgi:hypothetical protein
MCTVFNHRLDHQKIQIGVFIGVSARLRTEQHDLLSLGRCQRQGLNRTRQCGGISVHRTAPSRVSLHRVGVAPLPVHTGISRRVAAGCCGADRHIGEFTSFQ